MEHAQTCQSPPYVVAVMAQSLMTQQPALPPDVYSIAEMTKSSSIVLGRFSTIKSITGRIIRSDDLIRPGLMTNRPPMLH
jgi:hypothetical protein